MKKLKVLIFIIFFLFVIKFNIFSQENRFNSNSYYFNVVPRIWGIDAIFTFYSNYIFWIGGGYESFAYFRDNEFNIVDDIFNENTKLKIIDADLKLGYQSIYKNIIYMVFYKLRMVQYDSFKNSLFEKNNLKDINGILQNSLFFDIIFINYDVTDSMIGKGVSFDNSMEFCIFNYLNDFNNFLNYLRVTSKFSIYNIIFEGHMLTIQLNSRFILDYIVGDQVPIDSLSRIGGISCSAGIGGTIRGVPSYLGDGYLKSILNIDLTFYFIKLLKSTSFSLVYPGILFFFDTGYSGGYIRDINLKELTVEKLYKSVGIGIIIPIVIIDLRIYGTYFINKSYFSYLIEIGPHF